MSDITCKAVFFDLSGVLYDGKELIAGAPETVAHCREAELVVRFVTNTATRSTESILKKLEAFGIKADSSELYSAPLAAKAYIEAKQLRPYSLVHEAIRDLFPEVRAEVADCVILGDARDQLNYPHLNQVFQLCEAGAPLIAIGYNKYFSQDGQRMLDSGPFVKAIEWATGIEAIVMGKPGKAFFDQVVASTPYRPEECLMIGDDLEGDVIGAVDAGLQACLVQTGKFKSEDSQRLPGGAYLIESVTDLIGYLNL